MIAAEIPLEADDAGHSSYTLSRSHLAATGAIRGSNSARDAICYSAAAKNLTYLGLPNPRAWQPFDSDWKLPPDWKRIILDGMKERLEKYRSFRLFMDICVRCGACADKCHFYLGSADPKNMPVVRAELMRSVYRRYFTLTGRHLRELAGGRELTEDVIKEWFYYFYQCTECRRCSVFCPYGIDTAEITMMGRELLNLIGCNTNWVLEPAANCFRTGNHLGIQPHGFKDSIDFAAEEASEITGLDIKVPINRKGAEVLVRDAVSRLLRHSALLHVTWLPDAVPRNRPRLHSQRLCVGRRELRPLFLARDDEAPECQDLRRGAAPGREVDSGRRMRPYVARASSIYGYDERARPIFSMCPSRRSPARVFENARSTKMVHICEFTADLIHHGKLKLDPRRNDRWNATYHDSCNPARAMGLLEEPRYILKNVLNKFHEMPENTIREQTFCCGSGAGLGTDENLEMRMRGGFPRANAVKYVKEKHGVNLLTCICAIDKATLPTLMEYWVPGVEVAGVHELVGNALVMTGEKERLTDLRGEPFEKEAVTAPSAAEASYA